eukprot:scaffold119763_cov24-Phaeocystis_antarctica.AAC.1
MHLGSRWDLALHLGGNLDGRLAGLDLRLAALDGGEISARDLSELALEVRRRHEYGLRLHL